MIVLTVVALFLLLGLIVMMFLIRYLTRNQTDATDPSGKTLSPIEPSSGLEDKKSASDNDRISVKVPEPPYFKGNTTLGPSATTDDERAEGAEAEVTANDSIVWISIHWKIFRKRRKSKKRKQRKFRGNLW